MLNLALVVKVCLLLLIDLNLCIWFYQSANQSSFNLHQLTGLTKCKVSLFTIERPQHNLPRRYDNCAR